VHHGPCSWERRCRTLGSPEICALTAPSAGARRSLGKRRTPGRSSQWATMGGKVVEWVGQWRTMAAAVGARGWHLEREGGEMEVGNESGG
jgi:hypothetical protein